MEALLADSGIRRGFSQPVLAEAAKAAPLHEASDADRVDLRDLFTFTVDPVMAQDFDDALSFERTGRRHHHRLRAHRRRLVLRARRARPSTGRRCAAATRCTWPRAWSRCCRRCSRPGVCSLRPDEDRKTVTVEMDVDDGGRVLRSRFYRSLIRSDARLDYEQVERMFRGLEPMDAELAEPLGLGEGAGADAARDAARAREPAGRVHRAGVRVGRGRRGGRRPIPARSWRATGSSRTSWCWPTSRWRRSWSGSTSPRSTGCTTCPIPSAWTICSTSSPAWGCPTPLFDPMTATSEDIRRVTRETAEWIDTHAADGLGQGGPDPAGAAGAGPGRLRDGQHRPLRAGLAHVLPLHVAHPPLSRPAGAPRPCSAGWGSAPEPAAAFLSDWAEHCSQTEREAAKIELKADDIVLAHLLKRRLDEEGWRQRLRGPGAEPHPAGDVRALRPPVPGLPLDRRVAARRVPAERAGDRPRGQAHRAGPTSWPTCCRCGCWPSTRCGGGWTSPWPAAPDEEDRRPSRARRRRAARWRGRRSRGRPRASGGGRAAAAAARR